MNFIIGESGCGIIVLVIFLVIFAGALIVGLVMNLAKLFSELFSSLSKIFSSDNKKPLRDKDETKIVFDVSEGVVVLEEQDLSVPVFKITLKQGVLRKAHGTDKVMCRIKIYEMVAGKISPVRTTVRRFSKSGTANDEFFLEEDMELPFEVTSVSKPALLYKIPIPFLTFSRKGKTTVFFDIKIDAGTDLGLGYYHPHLYGTHFSETYTLSFTNTELGYLDRSEMPGKLQVATVKLATLIALSDGEACTSEANVVKNFIRDETDANSAIRAKLNSAVRETFSTPKNLISQRIDEICRGLSEHEHADRFDILQVLFDVIKADGVVKPQELEMLEKISLRLNLDRSEYEKVKDKAIPPSMLSEDSVSHRLGLDDSQSLEEQLKKLSAEYRKWNSKRENSPDPKTRREAEKMVQLISEQREALKKKLLS